jgi:muramidase (phage lysozyme)
MGAKQIDLALSFKPKAQDNAVREHIEAKAMRYRLDHGRQIVVLLRSENQWLNRSR